MTAASKLTGLELTGGWKVIKEYSRFSDDYTGGKYSHSYLVENDEKVAFLKAFDFSRAFAPNVDTIEYLNELTSSFEHERDVSEHCKNRKLSRVSCAIGHGQVQIPGMKDMEGRVHYLIFEKASGDIRRQRNRTYSNDVNWCMSALRQACLGLSQLHLEGIAHQDIKPSNILHLDGDIFQVADLGRCSVRNKPIYYDNEKIAGTRKYAPPELLYDFIHPDFRTRRMGTDFYMLGNLAVFLFTGTEINPRIMAKLNPMYHYDNWSGTYQQVLGYLQVSFGEVLVDLKNDMPEEVRSDLIPIITQLCNPDINKRGIPKDVGKYKQFSLEKYVSILGNMIHKVKINQKIKRINK